MKKRTATVGGGLIALGILVGMFLNLFRGPGGGGDGSNMLVQSSGEESLSIEEPESETAADESTDVPVHNASQQNNIDSQPAAVAAAPQVVDVVVDDRQYHIRKTGEDGREQLVPIALQELVETVRRASGNEDGIRVRIVRRDSSRAAAEKLLHESLLDAGVAETAMQWD